MNRLVISISSAQVHQHKYTEREQAFIPILLQLSFFNINYLSYIFQIIMTRVLLLTFLIYGIIISLKYKELILDFTLQFKLQKKGKGVTP